jgi:ATP-dependent Lhr-like helicase
MLYRQELQKERIRQVLTRYGVIFRRFLQDELPMNQWASLFRTLRLMELSGEIIRGLFFDGIEGPHFTTPEAFQLLKDGLDEKRFYWMNACDPISPCGQWMKSVFPHLPQRQPTTHIVFQGTVPFLISRKKGRELEFRVPPDSPLIMRCIDFFSAMLDRKVMPWKSVQVESIKGDKPETSPYSPMLEAHGFLKDYRRLILRGGC